MKINLILFAAGLLLMAGCNKENGQQNNVSADGGHISHEESIPVRIETSPCTKVTDISYETGDKVGIYTVNYKRGESEPLLQTGNHLDNMAFSFDGTEWNPEKEAYWKDDKTPADFYCYFPYMKSVADIHSVPFAVKEDQSTLDNYKSSEFLYGKTQGAMPSVQAVNIMTYHSMSSLIIYLKPGKGYTEETLAAEKISIVIKGLKTESFIDLSTGKVMAAGSPKDMMPYKEKEYWRALVVPQDVADIKLLEVTVGDKGYSLNQTVEFKSNCRHKCTLTVNRLGEGVNIGIGGWETDDTDYGGVLE